MRTTEADWSAVRLGFMQGATFTALAEEYGVSRATIAKRARLERWAFHARVLRAEKMVRKDVANFEFLRRQGVEVALALLACCRNKKLTDAQFAAELNEVNHAVGWIEHAVFWKANSLRDLQDAKADRPARVDSALERLGGSDDGTGRWPEAPEHGPRKPFPWGKQRVSASRRAA